MNGRAGIHGPASIRNPKSAIRNRRLSPNIYVTGECRSTKCRICDGRRPDVTIVRRLTQFGRHVDRFARQAGRGYDSGS
jgi:hypothetical protein